MFNIINQRGDPNQNAYRKLRILKKPAESVATKNSH